VFIRIENWRHNQRGQDIPATLDGEAVNLGRRAEMDFVSRVVKVIVPGK
jgi:hypothetical protein